MVQAGAIIYEFKANTSDFKRAVETAKSEVRNLGNEARTSAQGISKSVDESASSFDGLKAAASIAAAGIAAAFAAAAAGIAVGMAIATKSIDDLSRTAELAKTTDLSTGIVKGFDRVGISAGLAKDDVEESLKTMRSQFREFREDEGDFLDRLKELGEGYAERVGKARTNTEALATTIKILKELTEDQAINLGNALFDEENGEKLVRAIRSGKLELEDFEKKAVAAGAVIDSDIIQQAAKIKTEIALAADETSNKLQTAFAALMPIVGSIQIGIYGWVGAIADATVKLTEMLATAKQGRQEIGQSITQSLNETRTLALEQQKANLQRQISLNEKFPDQALRVQGMRDQLTQIDAQLIPKDPNAAPTVVARPEQGQQGPKEYYGSNADRFKRFDENFSTQYSSNVPLPQPRPGTGETFSEAAKKARELKDAAEDSEKASKSATSANSELKDSVDRYIDSLQRHKDALQAQVDTFGKSNLEQQTAINLARAGADATEEQKQKIIELTEAMEALSEARKKQIEQQRAVNEAAKYFTSTLTDGLDKILIKGEKFSDVIKDIGKQMASSTLKAIFAGEGPLAGFFGTKGQNGQAGGLFGGVVQPLTGLAYGGLGGGIGGLFGGGRAEGGPVDAGRVYRVGEMGEEYFIPHTNGTIIPNRDLGKVGGQQVIHVNFNVTTPDVQGFARSQAEISASMVRAIHRGQRGM